MRFSKCIISALTILLMLCSCTPSSVKDIQHKIDKALEEPPSYASLKEIQTEYDSLLMEEQQMVKNYDQIQSMLKLNEDDIAGIFTAGKLQERLKNPNSIGLISVTKKEDDDKNLIVKIVYSANNSFGGTAESVYYTILTQPTYNEENDVWECGFERSFNTNVDLDNINTVLNAVQSHSSEVENSAQELAEREYERAKNEEMLDADKIYDNLSYYSEIVDITE